MKSTFTLVAFAFYILLILTQTALTQDVGCRVWFTPAIGDPLIGPNPDGSFTVTDFSEGLYLPFDEEQGKATGSRRKLPTALRIETSDSLHRLYEIICAGQTIYEIEFKFYWIEPQSQMLEEYFNIILEDAKFVSLKTNYNGVTPTLEIEILWKKCTWECQGIEYTDEVFSTTTSLSTVPFSYQTSSVNNNHILNKEMDSILSDSTYATIFVESADGILLGSYTDSSSQIFDFDQTIYLPYDPETGGIEGSRRITFFSVTKSVDGMTPLLKKALCNAEWMTEVKFSFYRILPSGQPLEFYQILLEDVRTPRDSIHTVYDLDEIHPPSEYIYFWAGKITWKDLIAGTQYTEWQSIPTSVEKNANASFKLQNFPNPFNESTCIYFSIPLQFLKKNISLVVYDAIGRKVKELFNGLINSQDNYIYWNGKNTHSQPMPSGTYFYRVSGGGESKTGRLLLIK